MHFVLTLLRAATPEGDIDTKRLTGLVSTLFWYDGTTLKVMVGSDSLITSINCSGVHTGIPFTSRTMSFTCSKPKYGKGRRKAIITGLWKIKCQIMAACFADQMRVS